MGSPDNNHKLSELVDKVKSWIPGRTDSFNMSRDFWMPDQSCRVCYECDSQFTIFNRRHHCRICGRVFCAKCTANSIPVPPDDSKAGRDDCERIRVCNYCFKQWEQSGTTVENMMTASSPCSSPSASVISMISSQSSCTCNSNSSVGSMPHSANRFLHVPCNTCWKPCSSAQMDPVTVLQDQMPCQESLDSAKAGEHLPDHFSYCMNRSDDEDDDYGPYRLHSGIKDLSQIQLYGSSVNYDEIDHMHGAHKMHSDGENLDADIWNSPHLPDSLERQNLEGRNEHGAELDGHINGDDHEAPSLHDVNHNKPTAMDFENNRLLWLPPEPEDDNEEKEALLFDDNDDDDQNSSGEWGFLPSSGSFNNDEHRNRDRSIEDKKGMKNIVEGHFRALVAQLLQVEDLPEGEEDTKENWLEIITCLSWEAATFLKPDTSKGGGMDPAGYVKVKCIACGHRSESMVVKGVACKKNVAHRRMASKIDRPQILILGGALEYQRVANHLSSFDTLLQQEMDHLKMAVAKIDSHHPNVLLVEKSVSRYAQDYLLAKEISLVLNIKKPLLERIARCTGAQIIPSIDHLTTPNLGYCDTFHVEKFLEEHGSAGQAGKKLTKTLMFFEGCPKPLGCTILLKGANGDELKKVKHVIQYGVFAAYHLALETSFLADEGASLPEVYLTSPIRVTLPDKSSTMDRSISVIPGFSIPSTAKPQGPEICSEPYKSKSPSDYTSIASITPPSKSNEFRSTWTVSPSAEVLNQEFYERSLECVALVDPPSREGHSLVGSHQNELFSVHACDVNNDISLGGSSKAELPLLDIPGDSNSNSISLGDSRTVKEKVGSYEVDGQLVPAHGMGALEFTASEQHDGKNHHEGVDSFKEVFPPSPSDNQSILVSLSTRCVWKGSVCERAHLFRIKYYGTFDKPLGRFLRDHLFDQSYRCPSCEMPSEAHVHCYTHRQGTLTISVKKLPDFILPGEQEGKIWMWHRCLQCPRNNGFPPATRRIVMSDAAWGLSFGKFLELSFSNHAAASRIASCGHSLHRDCLRFYGFGKMIACFRYSPIDVHSVYLPPLKLEFNYDNQEWLHKEVDEVRRKSDIFFAEVFRVLSQFKEKLSLDKGIEVSATNQKFTEMQLMLQKERGEFEKALCGEVKVGRPPIDILEINKLQRQLVFHSYVWDRRLACLTKDNNDNVRGGLSCWITSLIEKRSGSGEKSVERDLFSKPTKGLTSSGSLMDSRNITASVQSGKNDQVELPEAIHCRKDLNQSLTNRKGSEICHSSFTDVNNSLESGNPLQRVFSEEQFTVMENLSETLDAAWTGESIPANLKPRENSSPCPDAVHVGTTVGTVKLCAMNSIGEQGAAEVAYSPGSSEPGKGSNNIENTMSWTRIPFLKIYYLLNNNFFIFSEKLHSFNEYDPAFVLSFRELLHQGSARLLLAVGVNDTVVAVYDDEPTSIISYALVSHDYHNQISDEPERPKDGLESSVSMPLIDSGNLLPLPSLDETVSVSVRSSIPADVSLPSTSASRGSGLDPLLCTKSLHPRVSFTDDGPQGKVKYTVICYYAKRFETLRRTCCPSELDFIRSLSRCKKWGAQGGKSNVFFAKTLDDRFIIKQVTKTELESFIKFAPAYFKYMADSISTRCPTCLAKILGIYQVIFKHLKGGKESRMDVLVMENLLFKRNITRLYDLKGSSRSRYNPDSSGSNKVLLDQNLLETMPTSPIFMGTQAKRLLERAIWNDTSFLASIDVMDYSLLVGVDEEKHELVLGIIDFMRQYTWDKHLETWVKASGILGGPKNTSPTVISPMQYKKRFRKAMSTYFLMVPDQWSSTTSLPNDHCDGKLQGLTSLVCDDDKPSHVVKS